jgi:hypothetical protein
MTQQAKGAYVVEVALTASFGDRKDVVGIPKAAPAGDILHAIEAETGGTRGSPGALQGGIGGDSVDVTGGATAAIAGKDLVTKVPGVGAKTPLVHAIVATEGSPALCQNLKLAPAAERKTVGAGRQVVAVRTATGECARERHGLEPRGEHVLIFLCLCLSA